MTTFNDYVDIQRNIEKEKYKWLSTNHSVYGGTNHGKPFIDYIISKCSFPLIDIGCGKNNFVKLLKNKTKGKIEAIGIDFVFKEADIVCAANNIPIQDNFFKTITSFDFFEHLIQDDISLVLNEILRISQNDAFFFATVSNRDSRIRGPNGEALHPTIKNRSWWIKVFQNHGINIYTNNQTTLYEGIIKKN